MYLNRGAVLCGTADGDFEFTRQIGKFRMQGRPLTNQLAPGARVFHFIIGDTSKLVAGGVTDTVATGLNGVHLHLGQVGQDIRHILKGRPVQLKVLPRGEMAVTTVIAASNLSQGTQLITRQHAVRYCNTQHRRMALNIEAVLQP